MSYASSDHEADENDDAEQIPYRKFSGDLPVGTEATLNFQEYKKEKLPDQLMANSNDDETGGEEVEPGFQCSGGMINSLSSAQPED